jgi:hypothetical protein
MNNVSLPIHASVVVNFGSTSAYASVLGFTNTFNDVGEPVDAVIVQLAAPLSDGSLAAVVPRASCAVLPPKAPRRGYDRSLINTKKLLAGFSGVDVTKNKAETGGKLRVRGVDMTQTSEVADHLREQGYTVTQHPNSRLEFTCSPASALETSLDDGGSVSNDESEVLS